MNTALEGGKWSAARPGRTLPPGKTRYPFYRRLGGPRGESGREENLVPTGIRSRTVQPVVSQSLYRLSYPVHTHTHTHTHHTHTHTHIYIYNTTFFTVIHMLFMLHIMSSMRETQTTAYNNGPGPLSAQHAQTEAIPGLNDLATNNPNFPSV